MAKSNEERGLTAAIVRVFITSKLSLVFLIASFLLGAAALLLTPREEEPQIVVPVADVFVSAPGASAEEVEKLVATPLESGRSTAWSTSIPPPAPGKPW
jgi:multidrug efflux pump subunit AcrB